MTPKSSSIGFRELLLVIIAFLLLSALLFMLLGQDNEWWNIRDIALELLVLAVIYLFRRLILQEELLSAHLEQH